MRRKRSSSCCSHCEILVLVRRDSPGRGVDPHLRIVGFEVGDPLRFEADAAAVGDEFDVAVAGGLRVAAEFDPVHRQRAGGEQQDEERVLQQIGHRDVVAQTEAL